MMDPATDENVESQTALAHPGAPRSSMGLGNLSKSSGSSVPLATPSKVTESGQVADHINALFDQLKSNYERNASVFREKTQHAMQQLEDMEAQLRTLLSQLEDDRDELMDASEPIGTTTSQNVFEGTPASD